MITLQYRYMPTIHIITDDHNISSDEGNNATIAMAIAIKNVAVRRVNYFHIRPVQFGAPHWHLTWTASSSLSPSGGGSTPMSSSGVPK